RPPGILTGGSGFDGDLPSTVHRPPSTVHRAVELIHTVDAMQACADRARGAGRRLALVPPMGALHEGHLALVRAAKGRADHVTVAAFVTPTHFAPGEDDARDPRTPDAGLAALAAERGVDVVFAPGVEALHPFGLPPFATVRVRDLDRRL